MECFKNVCINKKNKIIDLKIFLKNYATSLLQIAMDSSFYTREN